MNLPPNDLHLKSRYYGYNKTLVPKLKSWGYKPPQIPGSYPFQHNGWFNTMRDYRQELGNTTLEQETAALAKNFVIILAASGIVGFLAFRYWFKQ